MEMLAVVIPQASFLCPSGSSRGHLFAAGRAENDVEMPALPKLGPMANAAAAA